MQIQGLVVGIRDGSYESKREPGKRVQQWNIDIYDRTVGVVPCQIAGAADFVPPAVETSITADVAAIRKINFGVGYVLTIGNVRANGAAGASAAAVPLAGKPPR